MCVRWANKTCITHRGVPIRKFPLSGHGFVGHMLYIDGKVAAVLETKKVGYHTEAFLLSFFRFSYGVVDMNQAPIKYLSGFNES